ncbi:glycosyl hydrolase [Cohnella soli]|uniref:Glycosyl hydrolase n=1 Tax=Cohnella soli TaxID=425005 RepID=A0ABW0HUQ0_9BACL
MTLKQPDVQKMFQQPSAEYRPAPLWVWNDDMEPARIREQLREFAGHGFGGAFVHPRPGLVTEYLSDDWFSLWGEALAEAERLGLKLYIYDENSYPSGFAGGHVPSELPDCLANCVLFKELDLAAAQALGTVSSPMLNRPGHPIRAFAVRPSTGGTKWEALHDVTHLPASEWGLHGNRFWLFELGTPETNSWLGGFAYVDLLRPEVTERFLQTTHEAYRQRFGDRFGQSIPALFTDEPEISPGNLFQDGDRFLPFSFWFAAEFEHRNGYDLKDYLPCLFRDAVVKGFPHDAQKVRYDYYSTMHHLWTENAVKPISAWCERHGIAYTGHYLEHNWPHPFHRASPAVMSMYEYMHWPAIDMLMTKLLHPEHADEQHFPANESLLMLGIREAHSAANQFDRPRVLCEAYGAGGWDSSFEDYKRIGDWLFVHGINFLNPHLSFSTIVGARKRDHPQSFDWRQPWWEAFGAVNDYFGRLSYALSQGKTVNRMLLLNPTTSSFLFTPHDYEHNESYRRGISDTAQMAQRLCDGWWDYDWGDEFLLERHGEAANGTLTVGARSYGLVLIPPGVVQLKRRTVELLRQYMDQGGKVLSLGGTPERVEGERFDALSLSGHPNWIDCSGFDQLDAAIRRSFAPRIAWASGRTEIAGSACLRREWEDGSAVYFLVNSKPEPFADVLIVNGEAAEQWDPMTGECHPLPMRRSEDGRMEIPVRINGSGSLLIRVPATGNATAAEDESAGFPSLRAPASHTAPAVSATTVTPDRGNMLPIMYCDATIGLKTYRNVSTMHAGRLVFEHHGFDTNPWDNAVQFKRRLLDRDRAFGDRSGPAVDYRFHIRQDAVLSPIGLIVERPELYLISVNGQLVPMEPGTCWLDHRMGQADIGAVVQAGENIVRLEAKRFSIFMEIEPVYVTGEFTVEAEQGRWAIGPGRPLSTGSWDGQGYPFYGSAMTYRKQVRIDPQVRSAEVVLSDWRGTIASVAVNGNQAGLIGMERRSRLDVTAFIRPGEVNDISVRVCGSFKNLLGPHFDPSNPRNVAWPGNWKNAPVYGPPPAESYDRIDYGLFRDFEVEVVGLE